MKIDIQVFLPLLNLNFVLLKILFYTLQKYKETFADFSDGEMIFICHNIIRQFIMPWFHFSCRDTPDRNIKYDDAAVYFVDTSTYSINHEL